MYFVTILIKMKERYVSQNVYKIGWWKMLVNIYILFNSTNNN